MRHGTRALHWAGISLACLAAALLCLLAAHAEAFQSAMPLYLSDFAQGKGAALWAMSLVLLSAAAISLRAAVLSTWMPGPSSRWALRGLALAAAGAVLVMLLPGQPGAQTTQDQAHVAVAAPTFAAFAFTPWLAGRTMRSDLWWRDLHAYSLFTARAVAISLLATGAAHAAGSPAVGVFERAALAFVMLWMARAAWHVRRQIRGLPAARASVRSDSSPRSRGPDTSETADRATSS